MHEHTPSAPAESGEPGRDLRAFRRCLSQFGTGVTVITAQAEADRVGVTANSFASLSLDPPLITWAIKKESRSLDTFRAAGRFAVNILASDQIEASRVFATPASDKFSQLAWQPGVSGAPLLDGSLATLECELEAIHEGGDHMLLVGRVRNFTRYEREPLLFVPGRYGMAVDHPGVRPNEAAVPQPQVSEDTSLMVLLLYAYQAMSAEFDGRRRAVGLTLAQSRVLAVLGHSPTGLRLPELVRGTYLGNRDAEDAVADLVERKCIERTVDQTVALTPAGRDARRAILQHLHDFDKQKLGAFSAEQIHTARQVLEHLIRENAAVIN